MRSKGQITIYIFLGLLIFFVVGIGVYFIMDIGKDKIKTEKIDSDILPIKTFVDECIKKASIESAYKLGLRGGYYKLPEEFLDTGYVNLPHYYYKNINLMPSKEIIEEELDKYINTELNKCINFSIFEEQGFSIFTDAKKTKSSILNNKVIIDLNFPLTIKKENVVHQISHFSYELPIRLGHIYDISKELIDKIVKEPYYIDLTFLLSRDLDLSVIHHDSCTDIYVILDNYSKNIIADDYLFLFATKIDEKYCKFGINETFGSNISETSIENNQPILGLINYSIAYINKNFEYKVTASDLDNDKLFFIDDTDLFNIHPLLGTIQFTPKTGQEGLYQINVTVVDINGGFDSQWFYLEIK